MTQGHQRRDILTLAAWLPALGALGVLSAPMLALAQADGFAAKSVPDALKALGAEPTTSDQIVLTSPEIAENGAVVQVGISSKLPKTQEIVLLVEKNPLPMAAAFTIPEGTEPAVQLRAKMGQSTQVWALVKADGRWYSANRETKVTLGGCGG